VSDVLARLRENVVAPLKARFVGRDEVIDLIALALVAGEHLFLFGPPGTAKSALIRHFAGGVRARYFEYMLTRFSEPGELFGPVDIARLREGVVATVTSGMLPEAELAFLDELFNANSAILNNLLTVLNERLYRRGLEIHRLPLLSLFSASNHLPEEETLRALFDRFLLRCQVADLPRESTPSLLAAGWELERRPVAESGVTADDLRALGGRVFAVELTPVRPLYTEVIHKVRDLGIALSDRRAVKVQKLLAASAVLCGRDVAEPSDLWVLRHVWDRPEQIGPLGGLIQDVLSRHPAGPSAHPLAARPDEADGEALARELEALRGEVEARPGSLLAAARLREKLARLSGRAAWVTDEAAREYLLKECQALLARVGA
jgi:MoxR-like ATPase